MEYEVRLTPRAQKELLKLPDKIRFRLQEQIIALKNDPRPPGVKKLKGTKDLYRIRDGNFRIIYQIIDSLLLVTVVKVADRKESYD
jgi:mRNA interferase RelE/StbE